LSTRFEAARGKKTKSRNPVEHRAALQNGGRATPGDATSTTLEIASTELARKINRDNILRLIRSKQPIARVDLARFSGLQNSTVSSLVDQLLAEGWVREGEALKTARGRRPTQISLNDQLSMLVADVHPGRAIVGAVDLSGRVLAVSEISMPLDVEEGLRKLGLAMRQMREQFDERRFEGAGVCLPGRVDVESGRLMVAPNLRWREFDIREELSSILGMPVEMENDANACLLSALWFGHLDSVRNAVLLAISEGVGASILAEGYLISGRLGLAGEFGHICVNPQGPRCNCGRTGCWELFASSRAALAHYNKIVPAKLEAISYEELCRLALDGVPAARAAIELQAAAVGRGLRMVTASLEPEVIMFAGEITLAWSIVEPILQRECKANLLAGECPRILAAEDSKRVHILGAAAVVLQRHTGYYRSRAMQR
jgi:predicted NBD/HSP70 family sugar kinase